MLARFEDAAAAAAAAAAAPAAAAALPVESEPSPFDGAEPPNKVFQEKLMNKSRISRTAPPTVFALRCCFVVLLARCLLLLVTAVAACVKLDQTEP